VILGLLFIAAGI
jgi:hypothetical protein